MGGFKFWKRSRVYRPELLLQQLEERIVLDAAVNPAPQDHPSDHQGHAHHHHLNPDGTAAKMLGLDTGSGAGGGDAGLAAKVPDSYDHVFNQDLNVVLISNALTDVKTISDAAAKDAKVIVYDAQHDNLATVVGKLDDLVKSTGHKLGTVALFDHGGEGFLDVGTDQIDLHNLWAYEAKFESLRQDLASGAQIQFYACDTAGNALGTDLVNSIALFAGANVFASVDDTGGSHGNWTLEYSSSTGASFHQIIDSVSLVSMQADLGGKPGEPMNTWFHGTGTFAGWDIFNYSTGVYYTKDYATFWDHKDAGSWKYYNTSAWVTTDALGDAPYGDGSHYHAVGSWFIVPSGVGSYSGHNAYVGSGVEYYQDNAGDTPTQYWSHKDSGNSWTHWDGSAWRAVTGYGAVPQNTWFHSGLSGGYDQYDYSGGIYYTKDYATFWDHQNSGVWKYYNTAAWVGTDNLGDVPYGDGYGLANTWFHDSVSGGTYNGYDVYIGAGVTFFSTNHSATGATFWQHTAAGAWSYYDGSKWVPTPGFKQEPLEVWFHGYGTDAGWDTYNYNGGEYFTHDYSQYWKHTDSDNTWNYDSGNKWVQVSGQGLTYMNRYDSVGRLHEMDLYDSAGDEQCRLWTYYGNTQQVYEWTIGNFPAGQTYMNSYAVVTYSQESVTRTAPWLSWLGAQAPTGPIIHTESWNLDSSFEGQPSHEVRAFWNNQWVVQDCQGDTTGDCALIASIDAVEAVTGKYWDTGLILAFAEQEGLIGWDGNGMTGEQQAQLCSDMGAHASCTYWNSLSTLLNAISTGKQVVASVDLGYMPEFRDGYGNIHALVFHGEETINGVKYVDLTNGWSWDHGTDRTTTCGTDPTNPYPITRIPENEFIRAWNARSDEVVTVWA